MIEILECATIMEDQLFLMQNIQIDTNQINISDKVALEENRLGLVFLSDASLDQCFTQLSAQLFQMDVEEEDLIGIVMRALSSCVTLKQNVFSVPKAPKEINGIQTIQDLDLTVCKALASWTSTSVACLIDIVQDMVQFLSCYGGVLVLPDGVTPTSVRCFWCRYSKALDPEVMCDICSHYVVEKPHSVHRKIDVVGTAGSADPQEEEDGLSLDARINVRQKKRQLFELKKNIQHMQKEYSIYSSQRDFIVAMKQLSPFLYATVGKLVIFLNHRVRSLARFSPSLGCMTIRDAMGSHRGADLLIYRDRLICCLKRVSLSSTNMKMIHERFEALFLDPLSVVCGRGSMLRTSIVAKKVLLALDQSAEKIVKDYQTRCKSLPEKILEDRPQDLLGQMFALVVTVSAYNAWLSSQIVNSKLHINVVRGDMCEARNVGLTLLYDCGQIGFQIDGETRVFGIYEDVVDMCVFHLVWLHSKSLCPHSQIINSILS